MSSRAIAEGVTYHYCSGVYSKLFASILDSSVWLEPLPTRVVWLTFLAAKDADGFARFATVENVALRARVSLPEAETAVATLEAPDINSSNQDHEGRRIERVPGGWVVLNAKHYDDLVRREDERRVNRERVRRYRQKQGKPEPEEEATNGHASAVEVLTAIKALAVEHHPPGQAPTRFIPRKEVEKMGPKAVAAYDQIGGANRVLNTPGEQWGFVIRDFEKAYR